MKMLTLSCLAIAALGLSSPCMAQCGGTVQEPHVVFDPIHFTTEIQLGSLSGDEAYLFVPEATGEATITTTSADVIFTLWLCRTDTGSFYVEPLPDNDGEVSELVASVQAGVEYRLYRERNFSLPAPGTDTVTIELPVPTIPAVGLDASGDSVVSGANVPATEGDYFKYTAPSSGSLSVVADDADNDLFYDTDLFVFNQSGTLIFSDTGGFDDGNYSASVAAGQVLYFLVRSGISAHNTGNYTLNVDGPPVPPPSQATSPDPSNGASGVPTDTDLSWQNGGGATGYNVYFGSSNPPTSRGSTTSTTYDPGPLAYGTPYYWRIDSVNATDTTTGVLWSFTTENAPPPPPNQAVNPDPSNGASGVPTDTDLSWQNGGGATGYNVYFGSSNPPTSRGSTTSTTYDPGPLAYGTPYYWRIDSVNAAGTTTGVPWSFTTEAAPPPLPNQATNPVPSNDASNVDVNANVSWQDGGGATSYNVYFGTSNPPTSRGNTTSTTYDPGPLANGTPYYWRIDSVNVSGTTTGDLWSFTTESASPQLPNQATDPAPTNGLSGVLLTADLYWQNGGGATSYNVYFGASNPPTSRGSTTSITYDPGPLAYETLYYWRIDSKNAAGITIGVPWSFTTMIAPPSQATTPDPTSGASNVPITTDLSWQDGGGTTRYKVYFGPSTPPLFRGITTSTTYDPGPLAYETPYYWRIDSENTSGITAGTLWSFTTEDAPPGPPSQATNPSPSNNAWYTSRDTVLTWFDQGDASSYDIYFGTTHELGIDDFKRTSTVPSFDPSDLACDSTYFWRIDTVSAGGVTQGAVWSFSTSPNVTMAGSFAYDHYGYSVSSAGDVDADGFADVIVGAYLDHDDGQLRGRAYVYSGRSGSLLYILDGEAPADFFGLCVSGAGDVDRDGFDDVIVGAPHNDSGGSSAGRAYVFSGATGLLIRTFTGNAAGDEFGYSVSGAGDVDGDGFSDTIVGAHYSDAGGSDAGQAYVFSGQTGAPIYTFTGVAADDDFGYSVSGAGDVDGDGFDDVIIGARRNDAGGLNAGRAYVYSGATGLILHIFTGDDGFFGQCVSGGVDIDDDGFDDVIVGAPFVGKAFIFSGATGSLIHAFVDEYASDHFGIAVSGVHDLNGDEVDDVIIGANDRAYVYSGASSLLLHTLTGQGRSVSGAGDVNGDGQGDIIVGAPNSFSEAGTAHIYFTLADCDESGVLDFCELADGILTDANGDGVPDECLPPSECVGDINADGVTDVFDFGIFVLHFGQSVTPNTNGDLDGDGHVDVFDFGTFVLDFDCVALPPRVTHFIDFGTLPDGSPVPDRSPIGNAYEDWGVTFSSYASSSPKFVLDYGSDGYCAGTLESGGIEFVIRAEFPEPAFEVAADVATATGYSIEMRAWDPDGNLVGSALSDPNPGPPCCWQSGGAGRLAIQRRRGDIATVEWRPTPAGAGSMIDNLSYSIPAPPP